MKNKIALKLSGYFAFALIIFSLILGVVFITLFRQHSIDIHKIELEKRAMGISKDLASFYNDDHTQGCLGNNSNNGMGGYGAYLRFIDRIAMADVWIVDKDFELITRGHMINDSYNYSDLPENTEEIINTVFNGETTFSESFSTILDVSTLTVGTPIKASDNTIIGVVLLHSPVESTNKAVIQGVITLIISIAIALITSFLLSLRFSITFTKPLNKIRNTAIKLSQGDYTIKTSVSQNDEIGELANTIDILSLKLYEADTESKKLEQMRNDFVANISHELRTPITVIRGSLEALCDGIVTEAEEIQSYYNQMLSESKGLQRLVEDLLDLSRLQNIDFAIEMQSVNIYDILSDVSRSMNKIAKEKNIEIKINNTALDYIVMGDYGRLKQMFIIIIDNAIKFSNQDENVYIKIYKESRLFVSIFDTGKSIPKEDLPYIFDRFFKTKSDENKNGTGLGLAIAKQIAVRHKANINVKCENDNSCEFIFSFEYVDNINIG